MGGIPFCKFEAERAVAAVVANWTYLILFVDLLVTGGARGVVGKTAAVFVETSVLAAGVGVRAERWQGYMSGDVKL